MQPEEVCGMKWASSEEILTLIRAGAFVPIGEYTLHECLPDAVDLPSVRIARIRYMESVLDRVLSGENHSLLAEHLTILESYYHSPLWQADYAADEAGDSPLALKRGVLSQDTIYDLLTDNQRNTKAR